MANLLVPKGIDRVYNKNVDVSADVIKVGLVRGYTYSSAHQFLSDVKGAGGNVLATDTLASKSMSSGVFDAGDSSFGVVASGAACNHLIIYHDTGTSSSSTLLVVIDTATGLPVTPNGSTISVTWSNTADRIFHIV
jgi:hypothetical protein